MAVNDAARIASDKELERIEKHLSKTYARATKEMMAKIQKQLNALEVWDLANKDILDPDEYIRLRQAKMFEIDRKNNIIDGLAKSITNVNIEATKIVNGSSGKVYAINRNYILEDISESVDITFTLYNERIVNNLVADEPKLLPKTSVDIPKDQLWNAQHIQAEIFQGVIQGQSIPQIAKNLRNVTDMNKNASVRNARTVMTGVENKGRLDGFKYAENLGIEMQKEWVASSDARTRDSHASLDGERVNVDESFSNGLEFPGDPSGRPEEVYNCRCAMRTRLKGDYR